MLAKYEREEKQNLKKKKMFRGSDSIQPNYAEFRRPKDEIQIQPVNFHLQNLILLSITGIRGIQITYLILQTSQ